MKKQIHNVTSWIWIIIACVTIISSVIVYFQALGKPLLGPHSFRQTQNAISSYYFAKEGLPIWVNKMPVLGPPWNVPTEFPLFQYLSASIHKLFNINLDDSGKLVSIAFMVLSFFSLALVSLLLFKNSPTIWISIILFASSPLYLFWVPSFMMETVALFFSLTMLLASLLLVKSIQASFSWVKTKILLLIFLMIIASVAAALQKGTTWASASGVIILVSFLIILQEKCSLKMASAYLIILFFSLLTGFFIAKMWISYGDSIKMQNPFAREIIVVSSPNHTKWNFGTWEQKLDPATWQVIFRHISDQLLVPFPLLGVLFLPAVLVLGAILAPKRISLMLVLLAGFASGPIVFTNLYFEHSYYWCANGIWLLLAVGVAIAGIYESSPGPGPKVACLVLTVCIAASGFVTWSQRYLPILKSLPTYEALAEAWTKPVQKIVPPQRTLLIVGNDWNPNSLYYAERRGLAFPIANWIPFPGPQLTQFFETLGKEESVGAVVVNPRLLEGQNQTFWNTFLQEKGFSTSGTSTAFGILFPAIDLKFGELR